MEISINEILLPTLERISSENGLSKERYASNIVESFLENQYRGEVMDELKRESIEDIKDIKDNLKNKKK
jgi:hypothetical protein